MKGYQYYQKHKKIKLRVVFLIVIILLLIYIIIKGVTVLPFFKYKKTNLQVIDKMVSDYDKENNRFEKKVLINDISKKLNQLIGTDVEDIQNSYILYLYGGISLRKALLEYNRDLRNMYLDKGIYYFRKSLAFLKDQDNLAVLHYELGKAYFYKGQYYYHECLFELEKAQKLGYQDPNVNKLIDFIKYKKGNALDFNELISNFKDSKAGSIESIFYDANTYKNNHDYNNADKNFMQIEKYFQDNPIKTEEEKFMLYKTFYSLGWLNFNKQNYSQALTYYNKALEFDDQNPELYYWIGKVYFEQKKYKQAKNAWNKVLELDPNNKFVKEKLNKIKVR